MEHSFSSHSSVEGHLGCFHCPAIGNRAAVDIGAREGLFVRHLLQWSPITQNSPQHPFRVCMPRGTHVPWEKSFLPAVWNESILTVVRCTLDSSISRSHFRLWQTRTFRLLLVTKKKSRTKISLRRTLHICLRSLRICHPNSTCNVSTCYRAFLHCPCPALVWMDFETTEH